MMERRKNLNDKFGFVDSMKIKDFIDYEQPNEYIVESDRYSSKYSTPVLTAGQSFILGYTNESKGIYKKGPCIIFDDFTTSVHYVDFPFKVKSSAMKILTTKSNADLKYCYYLLLSLSKMPPNHKRQWISTTSEKNHVLPSMDRQISIVKQLDLISDTIANYTNQIENLDKLVKARFIEMFGNMILNPHKWEKFLLAELCDVRDGTHDSPKYHSKGYPLITSKNITGGKINFSGCNLISKEDFDKINHRSKVDYGDILMPMIGTIGNPVIVDIKDEFAIKNVALVKLKKDSLVNNIFIKSLLESDYFYKTVIDKVRGGTQKFISLGDIRKLEICLPPIELQNQFADFARQVDKSREEVKKSLEKTQQLYDSLMQEYFG